MVPFVIRPDSRAQRLFESVLLYPRLGFHLQGMDRADKVTIWSTSLAIGALGGYFFRFGLLETESSIPAMIELCKHHENMHSEQFYPSTT